jgi:hypothetical protein
MTTETVPEAANEIMQPQNLEECLLLQSHFVGIPRITKKNFREFYRRGKTLQLLGVGFLDRGRMPTLMEIEENISLSSGGVRLDKKKWQNAIMSIIDDLTDKVIDIEKDVAGDGKHALSSYKRLVYPY